MLALVLSSAVLAAEPVQPRSDLASGECSTGMSPAAPAGNCKAASGASPTSAAVDPHTFGAAGDCVADDTRAYQAAIAAARASHRNVGGAGCFRITSALDNAGVTIQGSVMRYTRNSLDPLTWGHVLAHDSATLPLLQPKGDGWSLENVVLYDPAQKGEGSAPLARPPMIDIGGQSVDWSIMHSVVVNAYDFIRTGPTSLIGDARIAFNRIYAARRVYDLHGKSPEVIFESNNIYSPGVFQRGAVFGHGGMLANWTSRNGSVHYIDAGAGAIEGWSASDNFTFGYAQGFAIVSGALNVSVLTGEHWDQVAQPIVTAGTGAIDVSVSGGSGYTLTHGDDTLALPAFQFEGTGYHKISIVGFQGEAAAGGWCEISTPAPVLFVLQGGALGAFGLAKGAAGISACRINGARAGITFKPGYVLGSAASTVGLEIRQAAIVVSDTLYRSVGTAVQIAPTISPSARVLDRSVTLDTKGVHAIVNAGPPGVLAAAGVYDRP